MLKIRFVNNSSGLFNFSFFFHFCYLEIDMRFSFPFFFPSLIFFSSSNWNARINVYVTLGATIGPSELSMWFKGDLHSGYLHENSQSYTRVHWFLIKIRSEIEIYQLMTISHLFILLYNIPKWLWNLWTFIVELPNIRLILSLKYHMLQ